MPDRNPLVSIIICSKNGAEYFERCLEAVKAQTYKNIEIVVVDNFSTDDTVKIAKRYTDQVYQIGPERCTQFNYGFKKSHGEYIYHIAPDFVIEPDVVELCVNKMAGGYDALALHNRSVGDSIWAKVRFLERESYRGDLSVVAVRFMKRDVFAAVGGFDETMVAGEDYDLHNRIDAAGYKWTHVDAIENHVGEPKNLREVWHKFYYYGRTLSRYRQKHSSAAKSQFVLFRPSFRKVFREYGQPWLWPVFIFYLGVKYLAGAAGMIVGPPKELVEQGICIPEKPGTRETK